MKDPYQVLHQKKVDLERLRREIEALRVVAPLLSEDKESDNNPTAFVDAAPSQSRWAISGE